MGIKTFFQQFAKVVGWPFVKFVTFLGPSVARLIYKAALAAASKTKLGTLAAAAVEEVQNIAAGETDVIKHAMAFEKIVTAATDQGLEWKPSILNLLIELAVYLMKYEAGKLEELAEGN